MPITGIATTHSEPGRPLGQTVTLAPRSYSPRTARKLVRSVGRDIGMDAAGIENTALLAGELVTDRISATRRSVSVTVEPRDAGIAVRVHDATHVSSAPRRTPSARCEQMLRRFATSWGYAGDAQHLETWLLVRTPACDG